MGDISEHFNRQEFECSCGCGFNTVDADLLKTLQAFRIKINKAITITSGCRCKAYNDHIGGGVKSQHLYGRAADIVVWGMPAIEVFEHFDFENKFGLGSYENFTHIDTRSGPAARW